MIEPNQGGRDGRAPGTRARVLLMVGVMVVLAASALPAATAGARPGVGSFRVICAPSHEGTFDPIVFPGQLPAGHQHEFYGSTSTGPSSAPWSLLGSSTTCSDAADSSAYWHPTVFFNGVRAPASLARVYYTQRSPKKPTSDVQAWPPGLRVIAGDAHAEQQQSDFIVWWDCAQATMDRQSSAPTCPSGSRGLEVNARFPDCWDGVNLDSADHKSHMSYSVNDGSGVFRCDAAHPVALPYLHMIIHWDGQYPSGETVTLSSGSTLTFHADFMNGWDQERLESLLSQCIRTQTECGRITSQTQASPAVVATSPALTATTAAPAATTTIPTHGTTTVVTTATTTATTAGHHASRASSPASTTTTEADTRTTATGATAITMTVAAGGASDSLGAAAAEISSTASTGRNAWGVATVFGLVVAGAGLWALARLGYSRLRQSAASPRG